MNAKEAIEKITKILENQLIWFYEAKDLEKHSNPDLRIDDEYIYDCAQEEFSELPRKAYSQILEILAEANNEITK